MRTVAELNNLPDGVHDLTREEYDKIDRTNFSRLKHIERSPAHFLHELTAVDGEDTDARQRGRAVSAAVFEPERFRSQFVVWTGGARRGKEWEAFKDRNPDAEILTEGMHAHAVGIAKAVRDCAMAKPYLSGGKGEQTLIWTHVSPPVGGLPGYSVKCKGRLDFIATANGGAIVDLKSTKDGSPDGFGRECVRYLSHVQAAWYVDGYKAATGRDVPFVIVASEASPPFVTQPYRVDLDLLELGRVRYQGWLDRLNVCRQTSNYPGYAESPMALVLPKWALPRSEEFLDGGGA